MIQNYGLVLDSLIVVLLLATIVYAATLSRRLSRLRDGRAELERAVRAFSAAAAQADAGIQGLKLAADGVGTTLQAEIDSARALRDELTFLVEAGEGLAGRLEAVASNAGHAARRRAADAGGTGAEAMAKGGRGARSGRVDGDGPAGGEADPDLLKTIANLQ